MVKHQQAARLSLRLLIDVYHGYASQRSSSHGHQGQRRSHALCGAVSLSVCAPPAVRQRASWAVRPLISEVKRFGGLQLAYL